MNTRCLHCQSSIPYQFRWSDLLSFSIFQTDPLLPVAEWLCSSCQNQIQWLEGKLCPLCSRSLDKLDQTYIKEYDTQHICYDCYRWKQWELQAGSGHILERNISAISYNSLAQAWIEQFKYRRDTRIKYLLASIIAEKALQQLNNEQIDIVMPIPLSPSRAGERGFNQAEELAECVNLRLKAPIGRDILLKTGDDFKQSKKGRDERLAEMLKKFLKNPHTQVDIYKKRILLIDDVYTTGATLYAAAFILKQEGAAAVTSLTLAR